MPAVRSYGTLWLIEAELAGRDGAKEVPAVINYNGGRIFLRDVTTNGYRRAVADVPRRTTPRRSASPGRTSPAARGRTWREYFSHPATSPFGGPTKSLRLPFRKRRTCRGTTRQDVGRGRRLLGPTRPARTDSSAAIQKAIDSGATTVFLPGYYAVGKPLVVRGKVRRVLGTGGWVDYDGKSKPDFASPDGDEKVVMIEHIAPSTAGSRSRRTGRVVLRSLQSPRLTHKGKEHLHLGDAVERLIEPEGGLALEPGVPVADVAHARRRPRSPRATRDDLEHDLGRVLQVGVGTITASPPSVGRCPP